MTAPTEIVLASRNPAKLEEMSALLAPLGARLRAQSEFAEAAAEESAPTYVENALAKARFAASVSGLPAIADDSGLEVAALHGAPGLHSARYAGADASDLQNNQKLLAALKRVAEAKRGARYVCVMVFLRAPDDPLPVIAQAAWRGSILHNPRGSHGFGYDPLFYIPELERSAAELSPEIKNRVSHRGKAARQLVSLLHDAAD